MRKGERDPQRRHQGYYSQPVSRREFFGISGRTLAVAGGVLAAGGLGTKLAVDFFSNKGVEDKLAEYRKQEQELQPLIDSFEAGFDVFAQQARPMIAQQIADPSAREDLLIPLELFTINKQNSDRNIFTLKRKNLEGTRSVQNTKVAMGNANYFYYNTVPSETRGVVATFSPPSRELSISRVYDPNNILDNAIATHELIHVGQDNTDRQVLPGEVYAAFFLQPKNPNARNVTVDIYEATAYIQEIAFLNLFTNGQFSSAVTSGNTDTNYYLQMLHARPEQAGVVNFFVETAQQYHSGRSSLKGIDTNFLQYIRRKIREGGSLVYTRTPNGFQPAR